MAFDKAAGSLILAAWWAAAAQFPAHFPVRHAHLRGGCAGMLTVDEAGVKFAGVKKHSWTWAWQDIQELKLDPRSIHLTGYPDRLSRLGADREYEFSGKIAAVELYAFLKSRMDQRLIAALPQAFDASAYTLPVKRLGIVKGSEGTLAFAADSVVYSSPVPGASRTWRYSDIENIANSGPFDLTIVTFERGHKQFDFQLKQPITEARYNEIWLQIQKRNGKLQ